MKTEKLQTISNLFEGSEIRSLWDSEKEDYWMKKKVNYTQNVYS